MGMTANGFPVQPLVRRPTPKASPPTTNSLPRPSRQRESPFHRNRSKVFYESHSLPRFSSIFRASRVSPENDKDLTSSSNNSSPEVRPSPSPRTPPPQIVLNSALGNDKDGNSFCRLGHFPFSISHKSQDSGFSDSGDSVSGGSNFSRTQSRVFYASDDSFKSSDFHRRSSRRKLFNIEHLQDNSFSDSEKISYREEDDLLHNPSIEQSSKLSVSCVDGLGKKALNNSHARKTMQVVKGHFLTRIGKFVPNLNHQSSNNIASSSDEEDGWQVEHKPLVPKPKLTPAVKALKDENASAVKSRDQNIMVNQATKEVSENGISESKDDHLTTSSNVRNDSLNSCSSLMNKSIRSSEKNNHVIKISVPAPPVQNVDYRTGTLERCRSPMPCSPVAVGTRCGSGVPSNISKSSALGLHLKETIRKLHLDSDESVQRWMQDIRLMTENESMNTLHNKPIAKDIADLLVVATRNTRDTIGALHARSRLIVSEFSRLKRKLLKDRRHHLVSIIHRIRSQIRSLINDYNNSLTSDINNADRIQDTVVTECDELIAILERSSKSSDNQITKEKLQERFASFADKIASLINTMLTREIKVIVDAIENPINVYCLKISIINLAAVGLDGDDTCRLIAKIGGVRNLLSVCLEHKYYDLRDQALRALATVCCIPDAIAELEKVGGIECITEILCDSQSSEKVKSEAAGLIAQITSPLIDNNHHLQGLAENMANLIQALTGLAKSTKCDEVFLLATAAMANITFLDSHACHCLCEADAPSILIKACREEKHTDSVFIKDQVATILANLVALSECRPKVEAPGGVVLLLCFLQVRPCLVHRVAEASACERVQQKSAIALSRLCSDSNIAQEVIKLQGIPRLVRLCKDEKERNQSDAVLVACLAALRKIATACGMDEFRDLNATELVEPRLLDSFLIYSSRQESYV